MKVLSRLIIKGGVLAPGELKSICQKTESIGLDAISFGSRQDIIIPKEINAEELQSFEDLKIVGPEDVDQQNIISSYVASDILPNTTWVTGDKYLYLLEQFRNSPLLKINITDPKQNLVPLFTGHLNFIASENEDYWYLYVRLPEWAEMVC